jgi:hypothetical protein
METLFLIMLAICGLIFVLPTKDNRPDGCTCDSYNWFYMGPVDDCPIHRHMADEAKKHLNR